MQSRIGPNRVGPAGLLQTPADALKLLTKEDVIPALADRWVFTLAPAIVFVAAFLVYVTLPFGPTLVVKDLNVGVVYIAAVTSLTVIGIVLAAWSSNNKYALIAAFRSAGQMVSYEIPLALALLGPVLLTGTLSFKELVGWQLSAGWLVLFQPIMFLAYFAAALAENNVTPFDIVEAESEIVAGFHVEYSGMKFALFFLAEFANTFTVACLTTLLFLGGWHNPLSLDPGCGRAGERDCSPCCRIPSARRSRAALAAGGLLQQGVLPGIGCVLASGDLAACPDGPVDGFRLEAADPTDACQPVRDGDVRGVRLVELCCWPP